MFDLAFTVTTAVMCIPDSRQSLHSTPSSNDEGCIPYPEPKSRQSSAKCVGSLGHATNQYLRMSERSKLCVASNLAPFREVQHSPYEPYGDPKVQRSAEPRCRHTSQNLLPHLPARLTLHEGFTYGSLRPYNVRLVRHDLYCKDQATQKEM